MSYDRRLSVVFNGEIYNVAELKASLTSSGYRFRTTSDTEVILYLYDRFGIEGLLERLNGMFAICIVDLATRRIFLARDRLGIKPLYIYQSKDLTLFASEIKSFLANPSFEAKIELSRLSEFLTFRYCAGSRTLLKGVSQLEPGQFALIQPGGTQLRRYWSPPTGPPSSTLSLQAATGELRQRLEESVHRRLVSDVGLGCQLSGGIDSSLINIFAAQGGTENLEAFSVVMDDPKYSEEEWVRIAAKKAGVSLHLFNLTADYFVDHLDDATWHMDQPLNHPNSIGLYFLAEKARKSVTVLLSGEGADELMGGYPRFALRAFGQRLGSLLPILGRVPGMGKRFRHALGSGRDPAHAIIDASAYATPNSISAVYKDYEFQAAISSRVPSFQRTAGSFIRRFLNFELTTYMVELLVRQDKMTMAHSLENRVPFLDHTLVEFVGTLPDSHLVGSRPRSLGFRERSTKIILKKIAEEFFDQGFVYRRKAGFAIPLKGFFGLPRMQERMRDEILPAIQQRGLFASDPLEFRWENLSKLGAPDLEVLWMCVAVELWASQIFSAPPRSLDRFSSKPL